MSKFKRKILFNEAMRQRALDAIFLSYGFNGENDVIENLLKIHGSYTAGFYEDERKKFEELLKK